MRTLTANFSGSYLKRGRKPRTVVRIPDAGIYLATEEYGDHEDKVESLGSINVSIEPWGGVSSVSGLNMKQLALGQRITLCAEASKTPKPQPQGSDLISGAGRIVSSSAMGGAYLDARDATSGDFSTVALVVGRTLTGSDIHSVYRSYLQYDIPADLTSCEEAYIPLNGYSDSSDTDFSIYAVEGTFSTLDGGAFNDFTGWAVNGAYTITALNETFNTSAYTSGINKLRLNTAGRAAVLAAAGGTLRIMLLSSLDVSNAAAPSGPEYVQFTNAATLVLRYNTKTLDNAPISVYAGFSPLPAAYTDLQLMWTGQVDDFSISDTSLSLKNRTSDLKGQTKIPGAVFTRDEWPRIHESAIGKPIPVIYGDLMSSGEHWGALPSCRNGMTTTNRYSNGGFCRGYVYEPDDITAYQFVVAGHPIYESDFFAAVYEDGLESFAAIAGDASMIVDSSNMGKVSVAKGGALSVTYFPYDRVALEALQTNLQPFAGYIPGNIDVSAASIAGAVGVRRAIDSDPDNWTRVSRYPADQWYCQFYQSYGVDPLFDDLAVVLETYAPNGYTSGAVKMHVYTYEDGNPVAHQYYQELNADGQHIMELLNSKISGNVVRLQVGIDPSGLPVDDSKPFYFRNVCAVRGFSREIGAELYIKIKGRMYGSWIDEVGRVNSYDEGDLIENPAHVIESIARDEMGLDSTGVDVAGIDAAATSLSGWKVAFQMLEQKDSRDVLRDLAEQCRCHLWWDSQDRITLKYFDASAGFSHSGTDIPSNLDTFSTTGAPSGDSFTQHPLLTGFGIERVSADDVYSEYVVNYGMNYATGEYSKTLHISNGSGVAGSVEHNLDGLLTASEITNLCVQTASAYSTYGSRRIFTVDAWAIQDSTTAAKLLQHKVQRHWKRWYVCSFQSDLSAFEHEPGDFINIRDSRVQDLIPYYDFAKWLITDADYDLDSMSVSFKAIQVQ